MSDTRIIPLGSAAEVLGHRLGRMTGRRRMDVILEKENAGKLVKALPAEDLFFLIKDVGLEDAAILVGMASPEQFRGFVDLDCWRPTDGGHELSCACVLQWLLVAREGSSFESLAAQRAGLDLEIIELLIYQGMRIVDRAEVEEYGWAKGAPGEDPQADWVETPCGSWFLCYLLDGEEGVELRRMIDELYAEDPFKASRFLSAVRSELVSELTEHALRFRDGRMEDMGFPTPEVAASLYAKVDISAVPPAQPAPPEAVPGFFLSEFSGESFIDQCAATVTGASARTFLDRSLMYLANTVLVADRIGPQDTDAVRDGIGRMRAYLNLGLWHLSGGDILRGGELLRSAALRHLFQVGFTLTLERKWRMEALLRKADLKEKREAIFLLDRPERDVLAALLSKRPTFALALGAAMDAGWPRDVSAIDALDDAPVAEPPVGVRPFAVPDDLRAVDEALGRAGEMLALAKDAGLLEPLLEGEHETSWPTLSTLVLTATLNLAREGNFSFRAIPSAAVASAVAAARDDRGMLREELAAMALACLTAASVDHPAAAEALMSMARRRFEIELGGLHHDIDPRFVDSLLVI